MSPALRSALSLSLTVVAVLAAGLALPPAPLHSASLTRLAVTVVAKPGQPARSYRLACQPPRGSVPHPGRACALLLRLGARLFAPPPAGVACTQIYGGPATARVVGRVAGRHVDARLSLVDGCQISRWQKLKLIVPLPNGQLP
jgi:hypothetical protein